MGGEEWTFVGVNRGESLVCVCVCMCVCNRRVFVVVRVCVCVCVWTLCVSNDTWERGDEHLHQIMIAPLEV